MLLMSIIGFCFFIKIIFSQYIMMKSSRLEEDRNIEEKIIKDVKSIFKFKKLKKKKKQTMP